MASARLLHAIARDTAEVLSRELPWQALSGARVAVSGAAGFLGAHLVAALLGLHRAGRVAEPVRVLGLVRDVAAARARWGSLFDQPGLELQACDLAQLCTPDLSGCTHVFHAASPASPRRYGPDPVGTLLPNTVGTAALLQALAAQPAPAAFVFLSSSEVYGAETGGPDGLAETQHGRVDAASLRACYAEGKRAGETLCVAWHHQHGLPAYLVRLFHVYGSGLLADDGRVHADFVAQALRGEPLRMRSDGSARRSFCHVADAVAGLFTVLLKGEPATPYNVGDPQGEMSVLELAELIVRLAPQRGLAIERAASAPGYLASPYATLRPDVSRLRALGWQARVHPAEGFARMLEAGLP